MFELYNWQASLFLSDSVLKVKCVIFEPLVQQLHTRFIHITQCLCLQVCRWTCSICQRIKREKRILISARCS